MKQFLIRLSHLTPLIAIALIAYAMWRGELSRRPDYEHNSPRTALARKTGKLPMSEVWQVVDGSVYDGDTLRVKRGWEEMKLRLCGIDAPEKDQPLGIEARDYLRSQIGQGDGNVFVVPVEKDRYGRTVAEVFVSPRPGTGYQEQEEIHLNSQMMMAGYAWHYKRFSGNCPNRDGYDVAEQIAKDNQVGVWATPGAIPPWEWRKSQR